jgi:hypothetical protein
MTNQIALAIVELNNGALTHFINVDYDKAIVMLRVAFETFEAHRRRPSDLVASAPVQNNAQQHSTFNFLHNERQQAELPTMMDSDVGTILKEKSLRSHIHVEPTCSFASSPSTAFSMYNRALVLSDDQDDYSLMGTCQHRTSAIILYNLALVHHNIGIHFGVSAALPHALRLYEMSLETIDQGANLVDVQRLLLAILNNMVNIHAHLFNFENTQKWLNKLRVVLAASSYAMAMDEDYVFFFLNALFQGKVLVFAPAA